MLTGTLAGNYKISIAAGATVTLSNAVINGIGTCSTSYLWAGLTCIGDATIILKGDNVIKGFYDEFPGIYVPQDSTLVIDGNGSLEAASSVDSSGSWGESWASGIGGGYNANSHISPTELHCGNIVIKGGFINASGGRGSAGIGGGSRSNCGNITIEGGSVTATGGKSATGIGSGSEANCGTITIGADITFVKATHGEANEYNGFIAPPIGAGSNGTCAGINIDPSLIDETEGATRTLRSCLYCIIDLSGGTEAENYPVSYLSKVPDGGWSDEYKTTKLVLRMIPSGTFTMGCETSEVGYYGQEATPHQVTIYKPFYIGVFETTQRQYELVMGTKPSYFNNASYYATRPVEQVSYDDIRGSSDGAGWPASAAVDGDSFLGKLRAKTGIDFDLPTEAMWEYACRAGTTTGLNSGKNLTKVEESDPSMDEVGRNAFNGGAVSQSCDTSSGTAAVGSYLPNEWGLYDMHGNVGEWCLDWWRDRDSFPTSVATDAASLELGSYRVLRSGGWDKFSIDCRSAARDYKSPSSKNSSYGFRLCYTPSSGTTWTRPRSCA